MIQLNEVRKLQRICASTNSAFFDDNGAIVKAVSVAIGDSERSEVAAILKGHETLCMTLEMRFGPDNRWWMRTRTWYPVELISPPYATDCKPPQRQRRSDRRQSVLP